MEDLYERIRISDLKDKDVVNDLFKDINALDSEENKEALFANLFKRIHDDFFAECMINLPEMDDISNSIASLRDFFVDSSGLSVEEIDRYFDQNNMVIDKIVNEMLDKVNVEIEELELELKDVIENAKEAGMNPIEYLEKEIEKLEEQKSKETKENNEQIAAIMKELERRSSVSDISNDEINQQIAAYEEQLQEIYHQGVDGSLEDVKNNLVEKITELNEELGRRKSNVNLPIVELEARIEKLEKQILEYNTQLNNMLATKSSSLEFVNKIGDLENEIANLEIELNELRKLKNISEIEKQINTIKAGLGKEAERFVGLTEDELEKKIEEIEKQILDYSNKLNDENTFKKSLAGASEFGDLENEITNLEIELNELRKLKNIKNLEKQLINLKSDFVSKLSDMEINQLIAEYEEQLQEIYHQGVDGSLEVAKNNLIEKIAKLKEELEKRKNKSNDEFSSLSDEELRQKLKELEDRNKTIQSETDKQVTDLKKKIEKLKRLEKLKKFAENRIIIDRGPTPVPNPPEEEIVEKKEKRKDLLKKCLTAIGGFVVGLGLSAVPGVGVVRMVASGAKLISSVINFWTNKFPEGKVAGIVNSAEQKINNNKFINNFNEKHPKIVSSIIAIKNKIKEILTNKYVNCFINGVSAGYITGNFIEMLTGQSISEHLKDAFKKSETIVATGPDPGVLSPPEPVVPTPLPVPQIELNPGEVFDISGISEGFVSSTAKDSVSLLTKVGKEAVVDKFVTLPNGEVMVHFKQINGAGYAWFKESVVKEHLAKVAQAAAKSGRTI